MAASDMVQAIIPNDLSLRAQRSNLVALLRRYEIAAARTARLAMTGELLMPRDCRSAHCAPRNDA